jgi:hypothetical protein
LTGFTGLFRIIFNLSHFPDGSENTQSAFSGIKWLAKLNVLLCFCIGTPISLFNYYAVDSNFIRRRRLGFGRSRPESGQEKNPTDPVNPV